MLDARHQFGLGGRIGPQLVGDHNPWGGTLTLEQFAHQPKGCPLVFAALQQGIEDIAVGIDSAPQPVLLPLDRHHHFIKLPFISKLTAGPSTKLMSEFEAELRSPFRDGLERDLNAALGQQIFDVSKAERKPVIEPNRIGDDLGGKTVASEVSKRDFGHCYQYQPVYHRDVNPTLPTACRSTRWSDSARELKTHTSIDRQGLCSSGGRLGGSESPK